MTTMANMARNAVLPWNSTDAAEVIHNCVPQQDIDVCLCCEHCASDCDRCDGHGNLSARRGRPNAPVDTDRLRELLRLRLCNREICSLLGVSKNTLARTKQKIMKEEQQ